MKNSSLPPVDLLTRIPIRIEKMKDGKHNVFIFKCALNHCTNEVRATQRGRGTGYCTSCLSKGRPFGVIYSRILWNAKRKEIECPLTYEEFLSFTSTECCVYCKERVRWEEHITHDGNAFSYNLDRKDSSSGYHKENLVVCCKTCNWAKNSLFTHEEFLVVGEAIGKVMAQRRKAQQLTGLIELTRLTEELDGYNLE